VNDVAGLEGAGGGDGGFADVDGAVVVAFGLDGGAALAPDGAGDAAAELELGVGGVDDGVGGELGDVALHEFDDGIVDSELHGPSFPGRRLCFDWAAGASIFPPRGETRRWMGVDAVVVL